MRVVYFLRLPCTRVRHFDIPVAHSTPDHPRSGASFRLRRAALALLKVPPEPHPPAGDPASLQVFHAGRNYLRLRLAGWATTQFFALAGILFWTFMLIDVEHIARAEHARQANPAALTSPAEDGQAAPGATPATPNQTQAPKIFAERFADSVRSFAKAAERVGKTNGQNMHLNQGWSAYKQMLVEFAMILPEGGFGILWGLKIFGFAIYLLQIPITYAVVRLDYEMRWYMVTDRSLRLRHGVWKVSESTMSFANVQQVLVTQGPLQRLLGLGDVKVQSAGGGGGDQKRHHHQRGEDMHVGLFHSVTNAAAIRDLIAERLRRFRETGLGDPDEHSVPSIHTTSPTPGDALGAARELLTEARALRTAVSSRISQLG